MDANVQVAVATVLSAAITTLGVIVVALINRRKTQREEEEPKDSSEILELVQSLVRENARKEGTIDRLRQENARLKALIPKEVTDA